MNINLQLKKRREIINKEKSHQRTKIIRQYKHQMANDTELNNNKYKDTNQKYDDFKSKEEKRLNYEKNLYGENINESDNEIINEKEKEKEKEEIEVKDNINNKNEKNIYEKKEKIKNKKFIGNKRTREEIEADKLKKINKRKKIYRNLHKTTKYGQPLMKYQIANLFDKIKKKKREGII